MKDPKAVRKASRSVKAPKPNAKGGRVERTRASNKPAVGAVASHEVIRGFVEHWGVMARAWGINSTMGELFALLYISGTDWTADALRERLRVSRGNVSMNLRELIAWGVVHKVHRQGERREFYRAETDVWTLFRRILSERKRRELDPTLEVLERTAHIIQSSPELQSLEGRVVALQRFFALIDALASYLQTLDPADIDRLRALLEGPSALV
jgi:DNA-binding transcriptional regulator GbsR (MarR family)